MHLDVQDVIDGVVPSAQSSKRNCMALALIARTA
jgi:hypothetical protein